MRFHSLPLRDHSYYILCKRLRFSRDVWTQLPKRRTKVCTKPVLLLLWLLWSIDLRIK